MLPNTDCCESTPSLKQGVVVKKLQGAYGVQLDGQTVLCAISNKLRKQLVYLIAAPTSRRHGVAAAEKLDVIDPVAIGDYVRIFDAGKDGAGQPRGMCQRKFKLWDNDRSADQLFPELRLYLGRCKFDADCAHNHEPDCAVRAAVAEGLVASTRYQSYLRLSEEE